MSGRLERRAATYTRTGCATQEPRASEELRCQREICERYIASQAHLGWRLLPERYEDAGFSGVTLERPAFQRLLADLDAGRIDVVVVSKIDRLSRSLRDVARVMDRFVTAGVAFVSVTQNFSTADAIGRLALTSVRGFAAIERTRHE